MIKKINKPWGWEKIIENNKHYTLKKLFMKKNCRCSLQFHKKKIETIYVLDGPLYLLVGKNLKKMKTIKLNKAIAMVCKVSIFNTIYFYQNIVSTVVINIYVWYSTTKVY